MGQLHFLALAIKLQIPIDTIQPVTTTVNHYKQLLSLIMNR